MDSDDVLIALEKEQRRRTEAVRELLRQSGRPDLLEHFDQQLVEIRLGVTSAKATWAALSEIQRHVMETMATGRWLVRHNASGHFFDAQGEPHAIPRLCGADTVRSIMSRDLIGWESGQKIILTEHGRFVLMHGRTKQ